MVHDSWSNATVSDARGNTFSFKPHQLPRSVIFEDLGLIVKFGSCRIVSIGRDVGCSMLANEPTQSYIGPTRGQAQVYLRSTHVHRSRNHNNKSQKNLVVVIQPYDRTRPTNRSHISTTEAINLWTIRRVFQNALPVPEDYGWRVLEQEGETREVFIYMQLIQGPTLAQQWPKLSGTEEKKIVSIYMPKHIVFAVFETVNHSKLLVSLSGRKIRHH